MATKHTNDILALGIGYELPDKSPVHELVRLIMDGRRRRLNGDVQLPSGGQQ